MGGEQAGEGGHEVDPARPLYLTRQLERLPVILDDAHVVAEPAQGEPGVRDGALQRVAGLLAVLLVGHGGEEAVGGDDDVGPGVVQQEAAAAVRVLRLARRHAAVAQQRRLLVPHHAQDPGALQGPGLDSPELGRGSLSKLNADIIE